jgi:hypothetical protein
MKKLFTFAALCTLLASCQFYYENIASTQECVEWYCEQFYDDARDNDVEEMREDLLDFQEWISSLDEREKDFALRYFEEWGDTNDFKADFIEDFYERNEDYLPNF